MKNTMIENENIEIRLLLEAIYLKYGYDFRNYSKAHIKRRVRHRLSMSGLSSISKMQEKIIYDEGFFKQLLMDFSINVTEMFRDPMFYRSIRKNIIPILKTYPFIKIWHAGCSSAEEVYSMAIMLKEEGLLERTQIYATDINENVLHAGKEGIYSSKSMKKHFQNYKMAGGTCDFTKYYTEKYDLIMMDKSLKKKILFAQHNLVTDGVFAEVNVVICRNVLIYFDKELQNRVVSLFSDSMVRGGYLCLGSKESIKYSCSEDKFETIDADNRIYKKIL